MLTGLKMSSLACDCDCVFYAFKPVNMDILFLQKICHILIYKMFCYQLDNSLARIPWNNSNCFTVLVSIDIKCNVVTKRVNAYLFFKIFLSYKYVL